MEKRVTLAIFLCVAVYITWMLIFPPPKPQKKPKADPEKTVEQGETAPTPIGPEPRLPSDPGAPSDETDAEKAAYPTLDDVVVDTDRMRVVLSPRGAAVASVRLVDYFVRAELTEVERRDPDNWLEVLAEVQTDRRSLALALRTTEEVDLARANWAIAAPLAETAPGEQRIAFSRRLRDGATIEKAFTFRDGSYAIDLAVTIHRAPGDAVADYTVRLLGPAGLVREVGVMFQPFAVIDRGVIDEPDVKVVKDLFDGDRPIRMNVVAPDARFVGISDRYFISLLRLPAPEPNAKVAEPFATAVIDEVPFSKAQGASASQFGRLAAGAFCRVVVPDGTASQTMRFSLFAGPRDKRAFAASGIEDFNDVLKVSNYPFCGMGWIVKPIAGLCRWLLNLFFGLVHNYGVAILMLTLLVKALMFPLTRKSMVAMHGYQERMSTLKPEMEAIQEKYKSDPRKRNEKMMALYKERGVSPVPPMGGCLPLLLNLPIFLGLFTALRTAPELRHAPFIGWIQDLSAPDALITFSTPIALPLCSTIASLNVLPILMGLTWFVNMWMQPRPSDPQAAQQQKIMMFMPIVMSIFLYNYASGLSLYWTFSNLLGIVEQKFIRKHREKLAANGPSTPPPAPPPRPKPGPQKKNKNKKKKR